MLHLTSGHVGLRQTIATGRISEHVTGRHLAASSATMSIRQGAGPIMSIPARVAVRGAGYFAFNVMPSRDMPRLSGGGDVTLRAEFQFDNRLALISEATIPAADIALENAPRTIAGQVVVLRRVKGAPFDLSIQVEPTPVALQGIVLHGNDPAQPVAGVSVEAGPVSAITDAGGRFFLAPLPLQAVVSLQLIKNGTATNQIFQVDYDRPVNTATFSLPA